MTRLLKELIWQDPVPAVDHELINEQDITDLKGKILASGLSVEARREALWGSGVLPLMPLSGRANLRWAAFLEDTTKDSLSLGV